MESVYQNGGQILKNVGFALEFFPSLSACFNRKIKLCFPLWDAFLLHTCTLHPSPWDLGSQSAPATVPLGQLGGRLQVEPRDQYVAGRFLQRRDREEEHLAPTSSSLPGAEVRTLSWAPSRLWPGCGISPCCERANLKDHVKPPPS